MSRLSGSPRTAVPARARLAAKGTALTGGLSRRLHIGSGSVIGGRVGLAIDPGLLRRLGRGRTAALVTGTNGKTTTTRLLVAALGAKREAVATNAAGSNLPAGLVAALVQSPAPAPAVLEVDEGYLPHALEELAPTVVAVLNLSRDQLDRVGEVRMVAARLRGAFSGNDDVTVVANADDPLVAWAAGSASRVVWVAAGGVWRADSVGCPACDGPIVYDDDGVHWSSDCGLVRPVPSVELVGEEIVAGAARLSAPSGLPGRFNRANAAVAVACAQVLGVEPADAIRSMADVSDVQGRFATAQVGDMEVRLLLAKNPAGFSELLSLLEGGSEPVVLAINARVADGHDPSWLWDVPFENLAGRLVVCCGERASDLAVRLRYGGVTHVVVHDQLAALSAASAPVVQYVGNYTAFQDMRRLLARHGGRSRPVAVTPAPARAVPVARAYSGGWPRTRRTSDSSLRVVVVHPDLLGTYGDGGNGVVLAGRAAWRGIDAELVLCLSGTALPSSGDIYCLGGGEDKPQVQSVHRLGDGSLQRAVDQGAVVLAVCAGYQIVGNSFADSEGQPRPGLGLLDVTTVKGAGLRAVGEVVSHPLQAELPGALTGFENHSGVTTLGPGAQPLAKLSGGAGNGDGTEGARSGNVFGTYMHGPVLARNAELADLFLSLALGVELAELDDSEEQKLHAERLAASSRMAVRRL